MNRELRFERWLAAPPAAVFAAFTSPEGQHAFYGRDEPGWIVESACDLRPGGTWSIAFGPSRAELYRHDHVFEAIAPPHRLETTCTETRLDGSRFDTTLVWTFAAYDGGTLMTMVHGGFPTDALRDEHGIGVPHAFDRFERLLGGQ